MFFADYKNVFLTNLYIDSNEDINMFGRHKTVMKIETLPVYIPDTALESQSKPERKVGVNIHD